MTSIYQAIMKAADHIEQRPSEFNIGAVSIPRPRCGYPGCALGWIAHFLGQPQRIGGYHFAESAMGLESDAPFYQRMAKLNGAHGPYSGEWSDFGPWTSNAVECARVLRLYAARYHAPAEPVADPAFTRFKALLAQDQPQRERETSHG